MTQISCPCGHSLYSQCCQPFHDGLQKPSTAEELMRSRYSAFALKQPQYLWQTLHSSQQPTTSLNELTKSVQAQEFQSLTVIQCKQGQAKDNEGIVEFRAVYKHGQGLAFLQERSRFVKEAGQWFYLNGEFQQPKFARNDPCWCGSGRKFKKCHAQ